MIEERDSVSWCHIPALTQKKAVLIDGQLAAWISERRKRTISFTVAARCQEKKEFGKNE
jgi:hypothetical protein